LNGSNYAEWVFEIQTVLQRAKVWCIVTGKETEPVGDAAVIRIEKNDWLNRVEQAAGIISFSVEKSQHIHIKSHLDNPVKMWTVLKEVHNKQLPITRFNAYDAMLNIRKEED
ncbi:hypothetical protein M422DRAFT_129111, partial [Sphaerobolus stellatus SS14]